MRTLRYFIYPFCSLFIVLGLVGTMGAVLNVLKARAIADWPTTKADVVLCDWKIDSGGEPSASYEVIVNYRYRVAGRQYESDRIHPEYMATLDPGAQSPLYQRLKAARVVQVRYNAADPAEAYLLSGRYGAYFSTFFIGLLATSAGLCFLFIFHFHIARKPDLAAGLKIVK
jgi:hypothetical protein